MNIAEVDAFDLTPKVIGDPECFNAFQNQLERARLPFKDLDFNKHLLVGYYHQGELVGTGGIEIYGGYGLLRSVSVADSHRKKGHGSKITYHLIEKARAGQINGLYLLTETARDFFGKIGFEVIDRKQADPLIQTSTEFSQVCPTSAVCMFLDFKLCC